MEIKVWNRIEISFGQMLGFNAENLFDVDIYINRDGSHLIHLDNYSDKNIEINILSKSSARLLKKGAVIKAGSLSKIKISTHSDKIVLLWKKVS